MQKRVSGQPIIIKTPVLRTRIVADHKQVKNSPPMKEIPAKAGVEQVEKRPTWGSQPILQYIVIKKDAQMQSSQNKGPLVSINSVPKCKVPSIRARLGGL